jgi:sugar lactone lactonase YvrE
MAFSAATRGRPLGFALRTLPAVVLVGATVASACTAASPSPSRTPSASPSRSTSSGPAIALAWTVPLAPAPEDLDGLTDAVAVGPDGNVYVVDAGRNRVVVYSPDGTELRSWGEQGKGPGQFDFQQLDQTVLLSGIAVAADGSVYVADEGNFRVQKFDARGTYLTAWGSRGSAKGTFNRLIGVAVGANGNVFTTDGDASGNTIQVFDLSGKFLTWWGRKGSGNDQISLEGAAPAAVGPLGSVYVADNNRGRVLVYDPSGQLKFTFGSKGSGDGQLSFPGPIGIDAKGNLFVSDYGNGRIEEFDKRGRFVTAIDLSDARLESPAYVAIGAAGELYVMDDVESVLAKIIIGS